MVTGNQMLSSNLVKITLHHIGACKNYQYQWTWQWWLENTRLPMLAWCCLLVVQLCTRFGKGKGGKGRGRGQTNGSSNLVSIPLPTITQSGLRINVTCFPVEQNFWDIQGCAKVCFPGSVNMRWKNSCRQENAIHLIFTEPGKHTLAQSFKRFPQG